MNTDIVLTREQSRQIDQVAVEQLGFSGLVLMENAARGAVEVIRCHTQGRIVILCGPGNNGGDGLAIARQLAAEDIPSEVFLTTAGKTLTCDAEHNRALLIATGISVGDGEQTSRLRMLLSDLTRADIIVDALLGTGIRGGVTSPFREIIESVNASPAFRISIDVPSGMDCNTGQSTGVCVRANHTVTFVARKIGYQSPESRDLTGLVSVAPIGIPQRWIREWHRQQVEASS